MSVDEDTEVGAEGEEGSERLGPVAEPERIEALDVLRGVALFGILMVNMAFFIMPFGRAMGGPELAAAPLSERLSWLLVQVFFEHKFIGLFALLFGAGFAVQLSRARARGQRFAWLYLRRIFVLFCIGAAHGIFLWYGDILLMYALAAIPLLILGRCRPRTLLILAAVAFVVSTALVTGFVAVVQDLDTDAVAASHASVDHDSDPLRGWDAIEAVEFDITHPLWQEAEITAYRDGPWTDAMAFRASTFLLAVFVMLILGGGQIVGLFLLGAAAMKLGLFSAERRAWHRRLVTIALPVGLLAEAGCAALQWHRGFEEGSHLVALSAVRGVSSLLLTLGYVGLICLAVHGGVLARLRAAAASAGRMALTVYLGQTLLVGSLVYWWGLGWFGQVSRLQAIGLAVLVYAVLVAASWLWLRGARIGPVEWLWRSLTYLKLPPLRRR